MKKVLFITYVFPPVGGAGVQRTVKFLKYLPRYGWHGSVLTAANPSVPLVDRDLTKDIPHCTSIVRARTLEPSYAIKEKMAGTISTPELRVARALKAIARHITKTVLQPDPQVLWLPGAIRSGIALINSQHPDAIVVSGPPFSTFIAGSVLSRRAGIPLVLDYRDEWGITNTYQENKRLGPVSMAIQSAIQASVVRCARALVATTAASAHTLRELRNRCDSEARVTWIYNGFDADDLRLPATPASSGGKFRVVYTGTAWNLTSAQPFVNAINYLCRTNPSAAARLEVVFAGRRTPEQDHIIGSLRALPCTLTLMPYLDHGSALELMRSADMLLVLLSDVPGAERVMPAKVFEYLATRRPILAIGPPGEMTGVLEYCPAARVRHPGDTEAIANAIIHEIRAAAAGRPAVSTSFDISQYSREAEAGQLARVLDAVTTRESYAPADEVELSDSAAKWSVG